MQHDSITILKIHTKPILIAISTIFALGLFVLIGTASAAPFAEAYVRLDRMSASTATGGTVCAETSSTATEADVQVTFPSDFTVNATASNWTVTTANLPSGATAWPGVNTATNVTGDTVTFPSTTLTAGTLYCFNFSGTTTVTTGSAGTDKTGTIVTRTGAAAEIDSTTFALAVIADDQIVISATVSPTFSFVLGGNTDNLGALSTSSVVSGDGNTVTITTNAANGWITWVKSANQGLTSAIASYTISTAGTVNGTPNTLSVGTEGYVLDADLTEDSAGGGTVTIDAEYNGTTTSQGGTLSENFQPVASANGTANGDVVTLVPRVAIAGQTPAASDYTDVLTVVGAGRF